MKMNELFLFSEIYKQRQIEETIDAFSDLCSVDVVEYEDGFGCVFSDLRYDVEITKKEFENYLIDLINTTKDW